MRILILIVALLATPFAYAEDTTVQIVKANPIMVCPTQDHADAIAHVFKYGGMEALGMAVQLLGDNDECYDYTGLIIVFEEGDMVAHGNRILLPIYGKTLSGEEVYFFAILKGGEV